MKTENFTCLGVDVSASSITVHLLDTYPKGGLKNYWDKTRNRANVQYPQFFSNPNNKCRQKNAFDFAEYVFEAKPKYAALEPTGNHYSRIWATILEACGVEVLWVGHVQLRRYRGGKNLPNKSDAADALALAAYPHDAENHTESGEINPKAFLLYQPYPIERVRELCQQAEHLVRVQSPVINYTRQLLAWQFPEVARSKTVASGDYLPPLWGWLAQREGISKRASTMYDRKHGTSITQFYGLEIEDFTRFHANMLCDIAEWDKRIESELEELIKNPKFDIYNKIFDQFGFGLRVRSRLLSRIYPFESFLKPDGKVWIEHETREVKRVEKVRSNGKTEVKRYPGEIKRTKRNRSRDCFKMRLGMGTTLEQSGDVLVEKPSGSALCRMSFWQHAICNIETGHVPATEPNKVLLDKRDELKQITNANGEKLLDGKHIQSKLMGKTCNLLFKELVKAIAKT